VRWRPIPDHPRYEVSSLGDVRVARTGRIIRARYPSDSGYARVILSGRKVRLHLIVLRVFRGPPPSSRHHGGHRNGDKGDNRLRNLRWVLPVENEADKRRHGTHRGGGAKTPPSLSTVMMIRKLVRDGRSYSSLARALKLHRSTVSRYARGLRRRYS